MDFMKKAIMTTIKQTFDQSLHLDFQLLNI